LSLKKKIENRKKMKKQKRQNLKGTVCLTGNSVLGVQKDKGTKSKQPY
jgi:hypothetical protein